MMLEVFKSIIHSQKLVTALLTGSALILLFWRKLLEKRRYPPGPLPLPIIGNDYIHFISDRSGYRRKHWGKYGNVVSYVSQGRWQVMLFGYDAIYEAFVKNADHFSNRSLVRPFLVHMKPGLIFGDRWKDLRRQALMVLRDHGMGKVKIEEKIREELDAYLWLYDVRLLLVTAVEYNMELFSLMEAHQDSKTFKDTIGKCVSNIITQIVFGHRLDYGDSNFSSLQHFDSFFLTSVKAGALPFYKYWPWDPLNYTQRLECFQRVKAFISEEIRQHKAALDVDQPKDYIDSYLIEGVKTGDPIFCDEEELMATIIQLYIGGYDTTSSSLTWILLFLINYPADQQRLHEEINLVIGNRPVTVSDRESLPFTQSFLHEAIRYGSVAGTSLSHTCSRDTVIQGQKIPKDTRVWANLRSTYQDEGIYENPDQFIGNRFLDGGGSFVKPCGKQMLPFSIGKRACPGESLARTELFMIVVSFVQRFEVRRLSHQMVSEDGIDVFTHTPKPFHFNLIQRR